MSNTNNIFNDIYKIIDHEKKQRFSPNTLLTNTIVLHPNIYNYVKKKFLEFKDIKEEKKIPCKVIARLIDNETLEVKDIIHNVMYDSESSAEFSWVENNLSCDCNRLNLFYPDNEEDDYPCGNDRFTLILLKTHNGKVIWRIKE